MLIVTKNQSIQTEHLNLNDFKALSHVFSRIPCLFYFNCGHNSGASQGHKHMQAIPIDNFATECNPPIPIDSIIQKYQQYKTSPGKIFRLNEYKFKHVICYHGISSSQDINNISSTLYQLYQKLLKASIPCNVSIDELSHNVLISPEWIMIVPRTQVFYYLLYSQFMKELLLIHYSLQEYLI